VVVVGGGAAGMIAAGRAAELGAHVLLLEKMTRVGSKILISGKTRCNLTNTADLETFLLAYGPNGRFLQGPFRRFFRNELLELLQRHGLETKSERGGRVFPVSDNAADVVAALQRYLQAGHVTLRTEVSVTGIRALGPEEGDGTDRPAPAAFELQTGARSLRARTVILATGGASYPGTGSSGDGYRFAESLGHRVVPLRPALVPLAVEEVALAKSMQGLSLRNVRLTAFRGRAEEIDVSQTPTADCGRGIAGKRPKGAVIESRMGEMMLTHFGIGGPVTLLMSLAVADALAEGPVSVSIDLKPALDAAQLRQRLQRDFDQFSRRTLRRLMAELVPHSMIEPLLGLVGMAGDKPGHQITAAERKRILQQLKSLRFNIQRPLPIAAAIVTAGGVSLKEVDPRTMESRIAPGLLLCGEVLDLDADTGGYNLQAAFTTGYLAGEHAAERLSRVVASRTPSGDVQ
jgi:predicted flavoprotein YhiN